MSGATDAALIDPLAALREIQEVRCRFCNEARKKLVVGNEIASTDRVTVGTVHSALAAHEQGVS